LETGASFGGLSLESYHLNPNERINEAASRSWNRLTNAWQSFENASEKLPSKDIGTTVTRERWLLIRISHFVNDTVVLGVNFDSRTSEGVFCSATRHDLKEKLARIIDGKTGIKKLTRARVVFIKTGQSYDALNEIYVGSDKPYRISKYIFKSGKVKEEQKSSGIIVAAGAGSTAWYGSVVKENFDPGMKELRFVIREPYCGKVTKCNLINAKLGKDEKLYIKSKMVNGVVAADSMIEAPLGNEEEAEIGISPEPFKLILF